MPELNPYTPPEHDLPPPVEAVPDLRSNVASRGARIAGAFLLVNALLVLVERFAVKNSGFGLGIGIAPILDLLIGGSLVAGNGKYRVWAIVRCALGAAVFTTIALVGADYVSAAMQLAVSGALLALLIGRPGTARIVVSSVVFGLYALVTLVGLYLLGSAGS